MWSILALSWAFASSVSFPLTKKLSAYMRPSTFLFWGNLSTLPFLLILIFLDGGFPHVFSSFYPLMIFSSLLDIIAFLMIIWAIKHSPISLLSPLSSFSPVVAVLGTILIFHESVPMVKLLAIGIIVIGAYTLNLSDRKDGLLKPFQKLITNKGVQLSFLATIIWGITPLFQKKAITQMAPIVPIYVSFFGMLLVTLYLLPFELPKAKKNVIRFQRYFGLFFLYGIIDAIGQWAAYNAFAATNVSYALSLGKVTALFTILWGYLFFKEKRIKERLLGAVIMIIGTIILTV